MTIMESIRAYLRECPSLKDEKLHVDYLPENARSYSVEVMPCKEIIKRYRDGGALKQFDFVLASRNFHTASITQNTDNLAFYEAFSRWIEQQGHCRMLPILDEGRTARSLLVTTSGYPFQLDNAGNARYQIQMKLTYVEKGSRR